MRIQDAIYQLYPQVVRISGNIAYDANEQVVEYDLAQAEALVADNAYKVSRAKEYPDFRDYLDGIVKGDQAQIQAYIDACNATKTKYPKGA